MNEDKPPPGWEDYDWKISDLEARLLAAQDDPKPVS